MCSNMKSYYFSAYVEWEGKWKPEKANEDLRDGATPNQAQPSRRMTRSMKQDPRLGQDKPLASTSEPSFLRGSPGAEPKQWELSTN